MATIPEAGKIIDFSRRDYDVNRNRLIFCRLRNRLLLVGGILGSLSVGVLAPSYFQKRDKPYFGTTEVDGCLVSNDYLEVKARQGRGINDLVIRGSNVKAETGPGSECLTAARVVVFVWSTQDGNPRNDIRYPAGNNRLADPIVIANENYRVPIEAFPTG